MIHLSRTSFAVFTSAAVILASGCSSAKRSAAEPVPTADAVTLDPHSIVFEWQEAYEQKLNEFASSERFRSGTGGSMFDLRDLDGNGTPELMISPDYEISTLCELYTFSEGSLKRLDTGENGGGGVFGYIPEKKLFSFRYSGNGFEIGSYCSYDGSTFKEELNYYSNSGNAISTGTALNYEINGESVRLEDYDKALSVYSEFGELSVGRKYTFDSAAVDYALRYSESWGTVLTDIGRKQYKKLLTDHMDTAEKSAAFELCDLNGDNQPELVFSDGSFDNASCRIYTVDNGALLEVNNGIGRNGTLLMDIENSVVYAYTTEKGVFWSFDEGELEDYTPSASSMELGRKHLLTPDSITAALR